MSSILITGGLGFIGTALIDLLKEDYDISVIDNYLSGPIDIDVPIYKADIRDSIVLRYLIPQFDTIVHLAGIVGAPSCSLDDRFAYDINVESTYNIIDLLKKNQKFIFISSTSSYGKQSKPVVESTKLNPLTSYGRHKALGERKTIKGKADYIILRPATAFGISKRVRLDLLPNTLAYIALTKKHIDLFEPNVIRPFIYVQDFARIIKYALDGYMPWNEIYNIGDPNLTMTKGDMASLFSEWSGASISINDGSDPDQRNYDVSFEKLLNTGFAFTSDRLKDGFTDIQSNIKRLSENPDIHTTVYNTQHFLIREQKNYDLYGTNDL